MKIKKTKKTVVSLSTVFCALSLYAMGGSTYSQASEVETEADIETILIQSYLRAKPQSNLSGNAALVANEHIKNVAATHINEVLQSVPGTWISRGNGQEHLTAIRSPVLTGAGACGAFLMAEDGIPLRAAGFCNTNQLFGVNSEQAAAIEVIKGPAGVYFGSNAVHGVINVLTPGKDVSPYLSFDLGPHHFQRVGVLNTFSTVAGDTTVYGTFSSDGGYKDDSGYGQEKLSIIHEYQFDNWDTKSVFAYTNLNQETAGFIQGEEIYKVDALKRQNPNPEAYRDSRSIRAYSQWRYLSEQYGGFSFTPYYRWHDMTFLQHFVPWQPIEENYHSSIGFQSKWWHRWQNVDVIVGADVEVTDGGLSEFQESAFAPVFPQGAHYDYDVTAHSLSLFSAIDVDLNEDWKLALGTRFDTTEYDYTNRLTDGSACAPDVSGCRFSRPPSQQRAFNHFTSKIGAVYRVDDSTQIFGNVTQGFRAPQATELFRLQAGQVSADLQEEKTASIEFGLRTTRENSQWQFSLFSQNKEQVIIQDTQRQFINGGETEHEGAELGMLWEPSASITVDLALTYAKHRYANDIQISRVNIKDNDIDTAPRWLGNLTVAWALNTFWSLEAEWQHLGEYYLNPENTAEYDGHNLVNLRAHWQVSDTLRWSLRLNNALDKDYAERADFAFGNYRYFVGEPRSVFIGLRLGF